MSNWTPGDLAEHLGNLRRNGHLEMLRQEAHEAGIPFAWVLAICSRETCCRNVLGDYRDGEPHGVGLMQVDIQHDFAREMRDDGTWVSDPRRLARFACGLLRDNFDKAVAAFETSDTGGYYRAASAAYNAGWMGMWRGHLEGDCDLHTTGRDYAHDVCGRMAVFAQLIDQE